MNVYFRYKHIALKHTRSHMLTQVSIRLWESRKLHLTTCWTSQLPTTSKHHSPTWILPRNVRIHAHI